MMMWTVAVAATCLCGASGFVAPLASSRILGQERNLRMVSMETETATYLLDGKAIGGPLTPISNSILVRVRDADKTTSSGIILPESSIGKPTEGEVIAMGPGRTHMETGVTIPFPCSIGDKVLYGTYDGTAANYMNADHQFIRDENVLFVYSGERMTPDSIKMIRDEILVKVEEEESTTAGGLVLVQQDSESGNKPSTGEVIAVGPGRMSSNGETVPMDVEVGDMIKFRSFAGSEVTMEDVDYRVIKMAEVLVKW
ncbi:unnamed protein product [Discosporangium mesarthrocarpum]